MIHSHFVVVALICLDCAHVIDKIRVGVGLKMSEEDDIVVRLEAVVEAK